MSDSDFRPVSFMTGVVVGVFVLGAVLAVLFYSQDATMQPAQRSDIVIDGATINDIHVVAPLVDNGTNRTYTEYVLVEVWTEVETKNPLYPVGPELITIKLPHLVRMTRGEYDNLCEGQKTNAGHF